MVYNDVGSRALIAQLPPGQDVANSKVDDELARELRLERLGLKFVFLQSLGEDMGISPATVVKKTLEQYTEKQFLPEFLANAEDAGASRFEVILNDPSPTRGPFLSYALEKLYVGPSVMVCNDSEFTEKDFDGICRTHIGGKVDQTDSIGQFGLGALTMFHIAEVRRRSIKYGKG
jgi:sacsin